MKENPGHKHKAENARRWRAFCAKYTHPGMSKAAYEKAVKEHWHPVVGDAKGHRKTVRKPTSARSRRSRRTGRFVRAKK